MYSGVAPVTLKDDSTTSKKIVSKDVMWPTYSKLALSQKIIIPFLLVIFSLATLLMITFGYWFASSLEQQMRSKVEELSSLVLRDFSREEQHLRLQTRLLADRDVIRQAVVGSDRSLLLQTLLPVRTTLDLDLVEVVNKQGTLLTLLRREVLEGAKLSDKLAIFQALNGVYLSDLINVDQVQSTQAVLVGLAPIKSQSGIIGGLVVGTLIRDELLEKISAGTNAHLVAFNQDKKAISTTLAAARQGWTPPAPNSPPKVVTIGGDRYLAKSIVLSGQNNNSLTIVLLNATASLDNAKQVMWLRLGLIFALGAGLATVVGILIARAIARPLQADK